MSLSVSFLLTEALVKKLTLLGYGSLPRYRKQFGEWGSCRSSHQLLHHGLPAFLGHGMSVSLHESSIGFLILCQGCFRWNGVSVSHTWWSIRACWSLRLSWARLRYGNSVLVQVSFSTGFFQSMCDLNAKSSSQKSYISESTPCHMLRRMSLISSFCSCTSCRNFSSRCSRFLLDSSRGCQCNMYNWYLQQCTVGSFDAADSGKSMSMSSRIKL